MSGKLSGEFILSLPSGDELVIPNQFTTVGMQQVLSSAFQESSLTWYMGLCAHNPGDLVPLASINEPGATNGYARVALPLTLDNWPTLGNVNGESFIETRDCQFIATGNYDTLTNRLFLTDGSAVIAISAVTGALGTIFATFSTKYRLYFR
jgi:hypothetical protein